MTFLGGYTDIFSNNSPVFSGYQKQDVLFLLPLPPFPLPLITHNKDVWGNSTCALFNFKEKLFFFQWHLNVGGHQLPLKHILPSTVARLMEESFDGITKVPVCSVLIRLLPHSEVCYVHIYKHVYHVVNIFSVEKFWSPPSKRPWAITWYVHKENHYQSYMMYINWHHVKMFHCILYFRCSLRPLVMQVDSMSVIVVNPTNQRGVYSEGSKAIMLILQQ